MRAGDVLVVVWTSTIVALMVEVAYNFAPPLWLVLVTSTFAGVATAQWARSGRLDCSIGARRQKPPNPSDNSQTSG
jgi:hypothetical protein